MNSKTRWWVAATAILGLGLAVGECARAQAPAADRSDHPEKPAADAAPAPAERKIEFRQVTREVIEERFQQVADMDVARNNPRRQAALKALFEEAGCAGERLADQRVKHASAPNVVCTLPGTGNQQIIVGAHFDSTHQGLGAADNWTGAALLPSLLQSLSDRPRGHTFVFVGFTDEEQGLVGSRHFAKGMSKADLARTSAMVNLDTLGLSHTRIWLSRSDPALAKAIAGVAGAMKLPIGGVDFENVGSTDSESFRTRKVPSITVHSVTQENFGILHSARDNVAAVAIDHYYESYRLIAAFLAYLDMRLDRPANSAPAPANWP